MCGSARLVPLCFRNRTSFRVAMDQITLRDHDPDRR
jgi:hypothetical protein